MSQTAAVVWASFHSFYSYSLLLLHFLDIPGNMQDSSLSVMPDFDSSAFQVARDAIMAANTSQLKTQYRL